MYTAEDKRNIAKKINCVPETLRKWAKKGFVFPVQEEELQAFIEKHRIEPVARTIRPASISLNEEKIDADKMYSGQRTAQLLNCNEGLLQIWRFRKQNLPYYYFFSTYRYLGKDIIDLIKHTKKMKRYLKV